jgi:hypothetical protein
MGMVCLPGIAAIAFAVIVSTWGEDMIQVAAYGPAVSVWTTSNISAGAEIFAWLGFALAAGPWVSTLVSRGPLPADKSLSDALFVRSSSYTWAPWVSIGLTAAFVVVYGKDNLWERSAYIPSFAVTQLASFVAPLLPAGFVLAALGFWSTSKGSRFASSVAVCVSVLVAFSTASRMLAVFPILWLAVAYMTGRQVRAVAMIVTLTLVALASDVALNMRNAPVHGLLPYSFNVIETPPQISIAGLMDSLLNVLFAVPLAGAVKAADSFGFPELLVSVNPNFGADAGWTELAPKLRVHQYIPFNGIGELATASLPLAMGACFLLSLVIVIAVRRAVLEEKSAMVVIALALYFLMFILLMQYNFRSSMRIAYLLGFLFLATKLLAKRSGRVKAGGPP